MQCLHRHNFPAAGWYIWGAVAVAYTVLMLCAGLLIDDWIYTRSVGMDFQSFWRCKGEPLADFHQALVSIFHHYNNTNGRLGDKLLILSNLLPIWVGKLVVGVAWGVASWALLRVVVGREWAQRPLVTALLLWSIFLLCRWEHGFVSTAVGMNYIVSAALTLPTVMCFLEGARIRRLGVGVTVLALFAGMMHEGFSLPLLAAMGWYWLRHRRLSPRQWWTAGWFILGTLVLMVAPGTGVRMGNATWDICRTEMVVHLLYVMPALWVLGGMTVIYYVVRWRRGGGAPCGAAFWVVGGMAGTVVALISGLVERAYWFPSLLMTAATFRMGLWIWPHRGGLIGRLLGLIGGSVLVAWLIWAAVLQARYTRQTEEIIAAYRHTGSSVVFADVQNWFDVPPLLMGLPQPMLSAMHYNQRALFLNLHPGEDQHSAMVIFPTVLADLPVSCWPRLGPHTYGVFPYYYVPGVNPSQLKYSSTTMEFDLTDAPWHIWNAAARVRGRTRQRLEIKFEPVWLLPRHLSEQQRRNFVDPRTGQLPDTLTFIYPSPLPRAVTPSRLTFIGL